MGSLAGSNCTLLDRACLWKLQDCGIEPIDSKFERICAFVPRTWQSSHIKDHRHNKFRFRVLGARGNTGVEVPTGHSIHQICFNSKNQFIPWTRRASRKFLLKQCKVNSEDSERASSSKESIILDEQTLERDLQIAVKEENYMKAAKIRDSLRFLQEDSKASVLAANVRFYNAFKNGNLVDMQSLWSKGDHVCVVHPGVSGISGYDLVMGSWEFVWAEYDFPLDFEIKDVQAHVKGELGYVTCIEMVKTKGSSWGRQFATNVFERIDGQWRICVHHASYVDL